MVVDKVLCNKSSFDIGMKTVETVSIEWFEINKKILKKVTSNGEEIGIKIQSGVNDGDILFVDDEKVIIVDIIPTELINVNINNIKDMGKLCYELGNRHLSLYISETCVKVPYDNPTFEYLKKLGFDPQKVNEKFTDFTQCHAHAHGEEHHAH